MATEEWIQESLARLESLEEERKKHEDALETASDPATLRMHTQAVERLEVKIRALYAELEAVAAQDGDGSDDAGDDEDDAVADSDDDLDDSEPAPAPVRAAPARPAAAAFESPAASPFGSAPAAAPFSSAPASPFGDAPAAAPFSSAPADSPGFSSSSPAASFDAGDDHEGGSGSKIGLIIGLVLVLGGVGAYFAFGRKPVEETPPPAAPTELKVIKSGEVPPDTQGPRTAKGSDIDVAHGAQIKESDRRPSGGGGGGGGSNSSPPSSSEPKKKKEDKATKIESTDDPLAGIR